jgi:NAD(P)-dependent dehydrogenase (short-subunit alcohol dehydrogenase family)
MTEFPLPYMSHDLSGRVALVTGASAGLGERMARVLAAAGAKVALCARRIDRLETIVQEIRASGGEAIAVETDVTDVASLTSSVDAAQQAFGLVDILVNNAGINDAMRAQKIPLELYDRLMAVNVRAPWLLSCEVARRLIAAKKPGRIVNLSSLIAFRYEGQGAALYAMSKSAIARMTEVLSVEWAFAHINVNAIAPGAFRSEMMDGMLSRIGTEHIDHYPRKRLGEPAQIDSTLLYLVSPASEFVTGTVIRVDDGQAGGA